MIGNSLTTTRWPTHSPNDTPHQTEPGSADVTPETPPPQGTYPERLQRNSNGNVFAYFTLGMTAIALVGLVNWSARQRPTDSDLASALRGLPILWQQLVEQVPSVRLDPAVPLDRDEATVRMITECIDALVQLRSNGDEGQNDLAPAPAEILRLAQRVDPMTDRGTDVHDREVSGFPGRS